MKMIISLLVLAIAVPALASTGSSGAAVLMFDAFGARSMGLAETFTGVAEGAESLNANPAGLNTLKGFSFTGSYASWFSGTSFMGVGGGMPLKGNKGVVGGGILYFGSGSIDAMNGNLEKVKGVTLEASDIAVIGAYAFNPTAFGKSAKGKPNVSIGVAGKYISSTLPALEGGEDAVSTTFAADLGVVYRMTMKVSGRGRGGNRRYRLSRPGSDRRRRHGSRSWCRCAAS